MSLKIEEIKILEQEPMCKHTTFRIGGAAKYFAMPKNTAEIQTLIAYCKEHKLDYCVLGNGSNVLFTDAGYDGLIIQIGSAMSEIRVDGTSVYAQAGAILARVANLAYEAGLTGMEFAAGIPGSIGGAIVMNAGAYGGEMKDIVSYVEVLSMDGTLRSYACDEMEFAYRHSIIDADKIVVGVGLTLEHGDKTAILDRMNELAEARRSKQPLEYPSACARARREKQPLNLPSAGSTFKRPEGYFAAKLIDDSGLRGYRVGGAMVSEKHCGFVVNVEQASSADVLAVMQHVQEVVNEKYGVMLEPEVRIIR